MFKQTWVQPQTNTQKGVLTAKGKAKRLMFARKLVKVILSNPDFCKKDISFYLDCVSFIHKTNPQGEAIKPRAHVWFGLVKTKRRTSSNCKGIQELYLMVAVS